MEVLLVNRKHHKLLQNYLRKVNNLIKYMYETMLVIATCNVYLHPRGNAFVTNSVDLEKTWC